MARLHRNNDGRLEPCTATVRACRYGEHFENAAQAVAASVEQGVSRSSESPLRSMSSLALLKREEALAAAAQRERKAVPPSHRSIASREEVYFMENGRESGNGVVVTRYRDASASIRLPIIHEVSPGEWVNVTLNLQENTKASEAFSDFLDGVEYVPPGTYRLVGSIDGEEVVTDLPTEHYARMRAALRTAEGILTEPLPERPSPKNSQLLSELMRKEANDD